MFCQYRPDLPARLEKVLRKSMEVAPHDRYDSALEFGEALARSTDDGFLAKLKSTLG